MTTINQRNAAPLRHVDDILSQRMPVGRHEFDRACLS
jgi:hypothetical protein